jgi:hypothetical protein
VAEAAARRKERFTTEVTEDHREGFLPFFSVYSVVSVVKPSFGLRLFRSV